MLASKGLFLYVVIHRNARNDRDEAKRNRGSFFAFADNWDMRKSARIYEVVPFFDLLPQMSTMTIE